MLRMLVLFAAVWCSIAQAAQSFALGVFPDLERFTLGSSNVATKVNLPDGTRYVTVLCETNAAKVAFSGTDAAAIVADYIVIPADTAAEIRVRSFSAIYVASATGSTVCSVAVERD